MADAVDQAVCDWRHEISESRDALAWGICSLRAAVGLCRVVAGVTGAELVSSTPSWLVRLTLWTAVLAWWQFKPVTAWRGATVDELAAEALIRAIYAVAMAWPAALFLSLSTGRSAGVAPVSALVALSGLAYVLVGWLWVPSIGSAHYPAWSLGLLLFEWLLAAVMVALGERVRTDPRRWWAFSIVIFMPVLWVLNATGAKIAVFLSDLGVLRNDTVWLMQLPNWAAAPQSAAAWALLPIALLVWLVRRRMRAERAANA
jgi:hypothetical protein